MVKDEARTKKKEGERERVRVNSITCRLAISRLLPGGRERERTRSKGMNSLHTHVHIHSIFLTSNFQTAPAAHQRQEEREFCLRHFFLFYHLPKPRERERERELLFHVQFVPLLLLHYFCTLARGDFCIRRAICAVDLTI